MTYSVITASLNSAKTISKTIDSVFSQTILPFEYIFVDGGSTDGTLDIIQSAIATAKDNDLGINFQVIHQETKGGIYEAWNMALQEMETDVAFILSSDDWYFDETASYVLSCFEEDPTVDVVLGAGRYIHDEADSNSIICKVRPFYVFPFAMTVIHPSCFVKKDVYARIGLFEDQYKVAGDYEFVYRCYKSGIQFKKTDKVLVNILLGGFSARNKLIARAEALEIGLKYSAIKLFPRIAYLLRMCLNR